MRETEKISPLRRSRRAVASRLPPSLRLAVSRRLVRWGSFRRMRPVSEEYGCDRGLAVDRFYIDGFLAANAADIRGRVLEVKDAGYTRRFGGDRVSGSEVLDVDPTNPNATIVADLNDLDCLSGRSFDCIILTQTLQYVFDLSAALRALSASLAPGGVILATLPGITRIAYAQMGNVWQWSFTEPVARRLFTCVFEESNVAVEAHGNLVAATAFLHGLAAQELRTGELTHRDPDYQVIITVRANKVTS